MHNSFKLKDKTTTIVFWFFIVLSLAIRLVNINSPITESHAYRQTQTALTIRNFVMEGIKIFNYETPLFGPPWQIPFEFPTFQLTAALLMKLGISNIDLAGRITGIFYFYISVLYLYLITKLVFKEKQLPVFILFYYLFNPFNIYWSRTCMIDYCSVAFSLGYLLFFIQWLKKQDKLSFFYLSTLFGIFAYLTKITTVFAFLPLMIFLVIYFFIKGNDDTAELFLNISLKKNKRFFAFLLIIFIIPFVAGYSWVMYADYVKNSSPFTSWLTSKNMAHWNYGTFKQRLEIKNWLRIKDYLHVMVPAYLVCFLPFGILYALKHRKETALLFFSTLSGSFFVIIVFFNLYTIHNYYLMAISPLVSIMIGISLYAFFYKFTRRNSIVVFITVVFITLTVFPKFVAELTFPLTQNKYQTKRTISDFLKLITTENEYTIITGPDWYPKILYYANRKGFMLCEKYTPEMAAFLKKYNFTTILTTTPHPELFSNWKYIIEIESYATSANRYHIFKVTDNPETLNRWKHQYSSLSRYGTSP
ncbi:MAG: hypothetical protein H7844_12655 [Nitrospirae bacterium YQR-1]